MPPKTQNKNKKIYRYREGLLHVTGGFPFNFRLELERENKDMSKIKCDEEIFRYDEEMQMYEFIKANLEFDIPRNMNRKYRELKRLWKNRKEIIEMLENKEFMEFLDS